MIYLFGINLPWFYEMSLVITGFKWEEIISIRILYDALHNGIGQKWLNELTLTSFGMSVRNVEFNAPPNLSLVMV